MVAAYYRPGAVSGMIEHKTKTEVKCNGNTTMIVFYVKVSLTCCLLQKEFFHMRFESFSVINVLFIYMFASSSNCILTWRLY